jgi:hypothetical protein
MTGTEARAAACIMEGSRTPDGVERRGLGTHKIAREVDVGVDSCQGKDNPRDVGYPSRHSVVVFFFVGSPAEILDFSARRSIIELEFDVRTDI